MPTISITLDKNGLNDAVKYLHRIERVLPQAVKNAAQRLAEGAKQSADIGFGMSDQFGNYDYEVTVESNDDGSIVIARGDDVLFLEFGAGKATDTSDIMVQDTLVHVAKGSWSKEYGTGEYARYGSWHYKKNKFYLLEPTNAMQYAYDWIQQNGERILREEIDRLL